MLMLLIFSFLFTLVQGSLVNLLQQTQTPIQAQLASILKGHPCETQIALNFGKTCESLSKLDIDWLSLKFTNCFLERSGKDQILCSDNQSFADCTSTMNSDQWHTYVVTSGNIDTKCMFYKYLAIVSSAQTLISDLSNATGQISATVSQNVATMKHVNETQHLIIANMNERKEIIVENLEILSKIENSTSLLFSLLKDHVSSEFTNIQHDLKTGLEEIGNNSSLLKQLESWVFGDYLTLGTLLFHLLLFLAIKYLGNDPRFENTSFLVSLLQGFYFILEKAIAQVMKELHLSSGMQTYITSLERVLFIVVSLFLFYKKSSKSNYNEPINLLNRLNNILTAAERINMVNGRQERIYETPPRQERGLNFEQRMEKEEQPENNQVALRQYSLTFSA